jgi:hypothetical protein
MTQIALKRPPKSGGYDKPDLLPDGKYRVKVNDVKLGSEVFNDDFGDVVLTLQVLQPADYIGRSLDVRVFPASDAIRSLVEVLGGDPDDETADLDFDAIRGLEANAYLGNKMTKKGKGPFNFIKRFAPAPKVK